MGLLSADGDLFTYQKSRSVDARFTVECLDGFSLQMSKPTVVVPGDASWRTAQAIEAKREAWEQEGLYLFSLPKYSPHLNRIERLWKQVEYHWLKAEDYLSLEALKQALCTIFTGSGTRFTLDFKELHSKENLILDSV